jgi:hypothetical protein
MFSVDNVKGVDKGGCPLRNRYGTAGRSKIGTVQRR